jgi:pimeloyl-ACP methyl ester carboxylesterase
MAFAEHRIVAPDGVTLYLRDYAPVGPAGGVPVLCLHGLTRNSKDFEDVAPWIAGLGRRVLTLDVRGRGQSGWDPNPARYQPGTYVGDVAFVLERLGVARAVFLGTSMGGLITMILAAVSPGLIQAAALNDIGPVIDPRGIARIAGYAGRTGAFASWAECAGQIRALQGPFYPGADDAFWLTFARRCAREKDGAISFDYDPAIAHAMGQAAPATADLMPFFRALAAKPVLVLRGALSDILSAEGVAAMRDAKPDLRTADIARVGHAPTLDEPDAREALAAFLREVG